MHSTRLQRRRRSAISARHTLCGTEQLARIDHRCAFETRRGRLAIAVGDADAARKNLCLRSKSLGHCVLGCLSTPRSFVTSASRPPPVLGIAPRARKMPLGQALSRLADWSTFKLKGAHRVGAQAASLRPASERRMHIGCGRSRELHQISRSAKGGCRHASHAQMTIHADCLDCFIQKGQLICNCR